MDKRIVSVSATGWQDIADVYRAILKAVDAPVWHGESINALIDLVIYGGINGVEPPYLIHIGDSERLPTDVAEELRFVKEAIAQARLERRETTGVDVDAELEIA